jgi:hypothetical protein
MTLPRSRGFVDLDFEKAKPLAVSPAAGLRRERPELARRAPLFYSEKEGFVVLGICTFLVGLGGAAPPTAGSPLKHPQ